MMAEVLFDAGPMTDKAEVKKIVRRIFDVMHRGWTDEDLIARPSELAHFCNVVRFRLGEDLPDETIAGLLMAPRKKGGNAFGKPRGHISLGVQLKAAGLNLDPDEFKDELAELFHGMYRNATAEEVLRRSAEGSKFCDAVRKKWHAPQLHERLICQTLINLRKRHGKSLRAGAIV